MPKYSNNGPEIGDIEMFMRAIEGTYAGQVQLTVTPAGISATGGVAMVLTFLEPTLADGKTYDECLVTHRYPCVQHKEFWSCIFESLWVLEAKIDRMRKGEAKEPA